MESSTYIADTSFGTVPFDFFIHSFMCIRFEFHDMYLCSSGSLSFLFMIFYSCWRCFRIKSLWFISLFWGPAKSTVANSYFPDIFHWLSSLDVKAMSPLVYRTCLKKASQHLWQSISHVNYRMLLVELFTMCALLILICIPIASLYSIS